MSSEWYLRVLFACLVLFYTPVAFSYVVVLNNGKRIEGSIVSEDADHIRIQDAEGVEITVRKNQLDPDATSRANREPAPINTATRSEEKPADRISKRTGKSKVWRKEDLQNLPEITIMGTESVDAEDEALLQSAEERARVEQAWKEAAMEIYGRLLYARPRYESLKKECEELSLSAGFATEYMLRNGNVIGSPVIAQAADSCARMEEAEEELAMVEQEMLLLEEEARHKGIPPGWVDPLRN